MKIEEEIFNEAMEPGLLNFSSHWILMFKAGVQILRLLARQFF